MGKRSSASHDIWITARADLLPFGALSSFRRAGVAFYLSATRRGTQDQARARVPRAAMSFATGSIVVARVAPAVSRPSPCARAPTAARAVPARRSARVSSTLPTPFSRGCPARPRATSSEVAESASSSSRAEPSLSDGSAAADHLDSIDDDCLFCSVDADDGFTREPVSMGGAVALVAGTTVGAGMLALPAVCQDSGFVPSTVALVGCWLYMVTTGILVLEVNLNTMRAAGSDAVSVSSMASRTLGPLGVNFACTAYVFIHYALLVAYVSRAGEILSDALGGVVPSSAASVAYAAALGGFMFLADASRLESVNSALVVVVLSTFAPLLAIAAGGVDIDNLRVGDWSALPRTIPVVALAFVYHNVVPTVASMMEGDGRRARTAIVAGTAIPFAMFVLWDTALLGNVSAEDARAAMDAVARSGGAVEAFSDPLAALRSTSETANALVEAFSFFAITTSFIGFVLGLSDFLADGLGWRSTEKGKNDPRTFALALVPPTVFALSNPDVFLSALDTAGTFGVLTLFGCLPPLMAWSDRYGLPWDPTEEGDVAVGDGAEGDVAEGVPRGKLAPEDRTEPLVPGGKVALAAVFAFAGSVVLGESVERLGTLIFDRQ